MDRAGRGGGDSALVGSRRAGDDARREHPRLLRLRAPAQRHLHPRSDLPRTAPLPPQRSRLLLPGRHRRHRALEHGAGRHRAGGGALAVPSLARPQRGLRRRHPGRAVAGAAVLQPPGVDGHARGAVLDALDLRRVRLSERAHAPLVVPGHRGDGARVHRQGGGLHLRGDRGRVAAGGAARLPSRGAGAGGGGGRPHGAHARAGAAVLLGRRLSRAGLERARPPRARSGGDRRAGGDRWRHRVGLDPHARAPARRRRRAEPRWTAPARLGLVDGAVLGLRDPPLHHLLHQPPRRSLDRHRRQPRLLVDAARGRARQPALVLLPAARGAVRDPAAGRRRHRAGRGGGRAAPLVVGSGGGRSRIDADRSLAPPALTGDGPAGSRRAGRDRRRRARRTAQLLLVPVVVGDRYLVRLHLGGREDAVADHPPDAAARDLRRVGDRQADPRRSVGREIGSAGADPRRRGAAGTGSRLDRGAGVRGSDHRRGGGHHEVGGARAGSRRAAGVRGPRRLARRPAAGGAPVRARRRRPPARAHAAGRHPALLRRLRPRHRAPLLRAGNSRRQARHARDRADERTLGRRPRALRRLRRSELVAVRVVPARLSEEPYLGHAAGVREGRRRHHHRAQEPRRRLAAGGGRLRQARVPI